MHTTVPDMERHLKAILSRQHCYIVYIKYSLVDAEK